MTDDRQHQTQATLRDFLWERLEGKARTDPAVQNLLLHIRAGTDREVALLLTVDLMADAIDRMMTAEIDRRRREPNLPLTLDEFAERTRTEWARIGLNPFR